jgi:putative ABC transport system ATP-binding protein
MEIVKSENLTKTYKLPCGDINALKGINFGINRGEFVVIMGPSGAGKTTLLNLIGCLDNLSTGSLKVLGNELSNLKEKYLANVRQKNIGFVFQDFFLIPSLSALENVEMAMHFARTQPNREKAINILKRVGLEHRLNHLPNELSGGEMQRVAIARSLAISPEILLADEPTGNLDVKNSQKIFDLLKEINEEEGVTILMATHNSKLGEQSKRVIHLSNGHIKMDEVTGNGQNN